MIASLHRTAFGTYVHLAPARTFTMSTCAIRAAFIRAFVFGALVASALAVMLLGVATKPLVAQVAAPQIPVRQLGPALATSRDTMGVFVTVRALSDGRVLVNDVGHTRVMMLDSTLSRGRVVIDTVGGDGAMSPARAPLHSVTLIRYPGDSTLYVDRSAQSVLVLDQSGKVARVMALPRPQDIPYIAGGGEGGQPEIDSKGRLVYHGVYRPELRPQDPNLRVRINIPLQRDSAPIVRADFDTRRIDTLMALKINLGAPFDRVESDAQGNVTLHYWANVEDADDQWAMMSDGTIAVISVQDYHVEFLDVDGTRRSGSKMPFDWKRIDDARKQFLIDSLRPEIDKVNEMPPRTFNTPDGPRQLRSRYQFLPAEKMGDYEQPITTGAVKADLNARLWIAPHTSASAQGGVLYDVVNRRGELVERVQFPKGLALVGFGAKGEVYVLRVDGKSGFLERRMLGAVLR